MPKYGEDLSERLRTAGLKATPQRLMVLGLFHSSSGHLSVPEAYSELSRECPKLGLATVYRIFEHLEEAGLILRTGLPDRGYTYELNSPERHHHHLVCKGCGKVVEFANCHLDRLATELADETRFEICEHALQVYGRCPACKNK